MYLSIINYLTNMDKNSRFLLIIIGIIVLLLILIFIFNYLGNRNIRIQEKNKKRLIKEINREALKITETPKTKAPVTSFATQNISIKEEPEIIEDEEEVIEVLQDDNESDVDRILREIKKASKEETMNLTEFEKEQEETAIISYDELCRRAGVKKKVYKAQSEEIEMKVQEVVNHKEEKKYKPTKYVSPIYGVQEDNDEEDLDKTFLQSLKEFRSTLDM